MCIFVRILTELLLLSSDHCDIVDKGIYLNENIDDESKANMLQIQNDELHRMKSERGKVKSTNLELNKQLKLVQHEKEAIEKSLNGLLISSLHT